MDINNRDFPQIFPQFDVRLLCCPFAIHRDTNITRPGHYNGVNKFVSIYIFSSDAALKSDSFVTMTTQDPTTLLSSPTTTSFALRHPPYTYLNLSLVTLPSKRDYAPLDAITVRTYLTSALSSFLGLTGTAIPVDILKVEARQVWIRVPTEDASVVVASIGQWADPNQVVSWKIEGRGTWLGGAVAQTSTDKKKLWSLET